jgi:hypothetical protein
VSAKQIALLLFLWTPNPTQPGVLSVVFSLIRMAFLSAVLIIPAILLGLDPGGLAGGAIVWAIFVLFEELARLSIVIGAHNRWRAGSIFTIVVVLVETAGLYRPELGLMEYALIRLPTIMLHALYTVAMIGLLAKREWLPIGFAGLVLLHWMYDVIASGLVP